MLSTAAQERVAYYDATFVPSEYVDRLRNIEHHPLYEPYKFLERAQDNIFRNPCVRGSTMLDIGTGPAVHHLIPACFYYSHIVLSDLVAANRHELEKWMRNDPESIDWTPRIKSCCKAHGYKDLEKGQKEVETLIRQNVKAVVPCNVLADKIVPEEYSTPYDLVTCCSVLEGACPDYEEFKSAIKKISALVKIGGFLILRGSLGSTSYKQGNATYDLLNLSVDNIEMALKDGGFGELDWQIKRSDGKYWREGTFCLLGTKIKECTT